MKLMNLLSFNTSTKTEIEQPNYFQLLKVAKPFLAMLAGDESLKPVLEMSEVLSKMPASEFTVKQLKNDPVAAEMIQERYMALHNLDELLQYPEDSLGYIYASKMKEKGFRSEDLYASVSINSDTSYIDARIGQTHDIWHIITGFETSEIDEIGLQAFYLVQFTNPMATMLIANALIAVTLFTPEELPELLSAIGKGWEMGSQAKPLFAQKWEENWEKPLTQWQTELNIRL
ncbi:MAG: ubiquinone biosynthesis protein [Limnoraphis sp. WC205]|jgi:ubiquinone biosynthesis protein COQ4|nr:ubiquinone biosynthesis protein [Limnoraphis sp. WC205]